MTSKLIVRMVRYEADANSGKSWSSTFVGVLPEEVNPKPVFRAMQSAAILRYENMCNAIDEAHDADVLRAWKAAAKKIECGLEKKIEKSTEGWDLIITPQGVHFEGLYGQGTGGQVSLDQFKIAIETYLSFLEDPERKSIEVVFPDAENFENYDTI